MKAKVERIEYDPNRTSYIALVKYEDGLKNYIISPKTLKVGDEISGHFVYGHVDCVTQISKIKKLNSSWEFEFNKNDNRQSIVWMLNW